MDLKSIKKAIFYDFDCTLSKIHAFYLLNENLPCAITIFRNNNNKKPLSFKDFMDYDDINEHSLKILEQMEILLSMDEFNAYKIQDIKSTGDNILNNFSNKLQEIYEWMLQQYENDKEDFEKKYKKYSENAQSALCESLGGVYNIMKKTNIKWYDGIKEDLINVRNIIFNKDLGEINEQDKFLIDKVIFGGNVVNIRNHLNKLKFNNVGIYISSFGYATQINKILKIVDLFNLFDKIICRGAYNDQKNIIMEENNKSKYIYKLIEEHKYQMVYYVDDSPEEFVRMVGGPNHNKKINGSELVKNCFLAFFSNKKTNDLQKLIDKNDNITKLFNNAKICNTPLDKFDNGLSDEHLKKIESFMMLENITENNQIVTCMNDLKEEKKGGYCEKYLYSLVSPNSQKIFINIFCDLIYSKKMLFVTLTMLSIMCT